MTSPGVTATTLGQIGEQLQSWPHRSLRNALSNLYGLRSAYPGFGHAGNPDSILREIDMRDLVAVSVLLAGFMPYLAAEMRHEALYIE